MKDVRFQQGRTLELGHAPDSMHFAHAENVGSISRMLPTLQACVTVSFPLAISPVALSNTNPGTSAMEFLSVRLGWCIQATIAEAAMANIGGQYRRAFPELLPLYNARVSSARAS